MIETNWRRAKHTSQDALSEAGAVLMLFNVVLLFFCESLCLSDLLKYNALDNALFFLLRCLMPCF